MKCVIQVLDVEGDPGYVVPHALRAYAAAIERGEAAPEATYLATVEEPPKREPLTGIQLRTYDAIVAYYREKSYMPTTRELCAILGLKSTNGVSEVLRRLHRKGYIEFTPMIARGLKIL